MRIYYVNVNKKRLVGRCNQPNVLPLQLEYDIIEELSFQFIDDVNQIQDISNLRGLALAIGKQQGKPSYDLIALSKDYTIENNVLTFRVNTYTTTWVNEIKKSNTEVYFEISQDFEDNKKVLVRDYCYAWPRVYVEGVSPEVIVDDYYTKAEVDGKIEDAVSGLASTEYVDEAVSHISGYATEEYVDNAVSGLASQEYVDTGLEGKQSLINDENKLAYDLLSGTPSIPTKTSELDNDSDFVTSTEVENAISGKADRSEIPLSTSQLTNDSGFITDSALQGLASETYVDNAVSGKQDEITVDNKLDYALVSGAPTVPTSTSQLTNDSGFVTDADVQTAISGKQDAITNENKLSYSLISGAPETQDAVWGGITGVLSAQTDLQNALDAKADTADVPTSTSQLNNDSDFVDAGTVAGLLGEYATTDYVAGQIAAIPLPSKVSELSNDADYQDGLQVQATVDAAVSGKQDEITNDNKLSYDLISGAPTVPTSTSQLTNDSNFIDQSALDSALSGVDTDVEAVSGELDDVNDMLEDYLQNQLLSRTPFYIEAVAANSAVKIGPNQTVSSDNLTLKYSTDNSTWNDYTLDDVIQLPNVGDRVYFKGNNTTTNIDKTTGAYNAVQCSGTVNAGGNIISLLDEAMLSKTLYEEYTFYKLFALAGSTLVDASKLQLPATRLAPVCYSDMFNGCTSLSAAPELPATKLSNKCYANMFLGCTSLTTAPELPATTLGDRCYGSMFNGCTALTAAPELPATNVAYNCYSTMFKDCSSLTTPPTELPAMTLANNCYTQMFYGCASLSAAPELPATTLASTCYQAMFYGCTSLSAAPELPATTLVSRCYEDMFRNCSNINEVKVSFTDWNLAETSTANWLRDTANTGTFYCPSGLDTTTRGNNTLPADWSVENI